MGRIEEGTNCLIIMDTGEMRQIQHLIWVAPRSVGIWGREQVWGSAMKRLIDTTCLRGNHTSSCQQTGGDRMGR